MTLRLAEAARGWWPARAKRLSGRQSDKVLAPARIERHGGLAALYLSGTPYEMGYQHGVLARDLIHGYRRAAYDYIAPQVPGPSQLARPLLFHHTASYWSTIDAQFRDEMHGIAAGAGVHPIEVLVSTAIWEIFHRSGCSEFVALGPATEGGTLVHGFNYDLMQPEHALIQPYLALIFYQPSDGIPFATLNTVGSVGVNAGMSAAGISVAWDNTYLRTNDLARGIDLPVAPFIITLRRLLQFSRNLDEAVAAVIHSLPRPLADIVIIGSAKEGRAVALETAGRTHALRELEAGIVWSSNCFNSPELAGHDRRGVREKLSRKQQWQRFPRYTAYGELFAANRGAISAARAIDFLRDPYPREAVGYVHPIQARRSTICRDITSWSLVMQPAEGLIWASDTQLPGCQGQFVAFDLAEFGRLSTLDSPPSGYHAALQCAECYLLGDVDAAKRALAKAQEIQGPAAPLLLMEAVLHGQTGSEDLAAESLQAVVASWPATPPGAIARLWLGGQVGNGTPRIPFPSAIRPLIHLQPGPNWTDRAVRAVR